MAIAQERKPQHTAAFGERPGDKGKAEVQLAFLPKRINHLTRHLRELRNDHHSRRGLLMLLAWHRRPLNYLQRTDLARDRTSVRQLDQRR
jgi:small subunit ribosomal protein S15